MIQHPFEGAGKAAYILKSLCDSIISVDPVMTCFISHHGRLCHLFIDTDIMY